MTAKMDALQVVSRGKAEFIRTSLPELIEGHAIVQPRHVTLCGSDVWMLSHAPEEAYPFPPGTTGHEVIAQIIELGPGLDGHQVGDFVLAIAPDHRAMAELYLTPQQNLLKLPAGKTREELLMAQQLGTVLYACKQLPSMIGKTVAVIGQGTAGLWFDFVLQRLGARRIIALDPKENRLELARKYGASDTINIREEDPVEQMLAINGGELADIVVEAAGRESSINLGIELARADTGFFLQFGVPYEPITVNYGKIFTKCLKHKSIVHANSEHGHASTLQGLDLIAGGALDVTPVLTHRFPFEQVLQAYDVHQNARDNAVKIVIDMP
jgi:L-iditol 2-dehydrogenase